MFWYLREVEGRDALSGGSEKFLRGSRWCLAIDPVGKLTTTWEDINGKNIAWKGRLRQRDSNGQVGFNPCRRKFIRKSAWKGRV